MKEEFISLPGRSMIYIESILVEFIVAYLCYEFVLNRVQAPRVGKNPWLWGWPLARADFVKNGKELTKEGYTRFKDSMFWLQTGEMERLVLSHRYLNELRRLPDSYLDSRSAV